LLLSGGMVDSLKIFEILKSGSVSEEHARVMTLAIQKAEAEIASDIRTMLRQEFDLFAKTFATKAELAAMEVRLMRWMFIFWIGQMAVTVGLVFEVSRLLK
jgi:hypothetical protein